MEFRDIITFEQQPVLIIGNEEKIEYKDAKTEEKKSVLKTNLLSDPLYSPILTALKKGPLTVRELEKEYKKLADDPKSDKTLYRYLKFLEKAGLVAPAGQRVTVGKTATEALYSRTAKLFYSSFAYNDLWECSFCNSVLGKVAEILSLREDMPNQDKDCVKKLMTSVDGYIFNEISEFFEKHFEEIAEITKDSNPYEMSRITNVLGTILLLNQPKSYEKPLEECLKA
ncbi:MAG: winged helix-turn-helix transcriptional regulator [Candidatus Heimdallarchaeota archaeon]|nr:winged helix-turn-helix transcriptional regulator [Candidatus Heimdallarchaeota archaeon]MCK4770180.1 winged helix-turn-helix transcriptional regulator [Candidatus Heimdallarchaeota archaeon]